MSTGVKLADLNRLLDAEDIEFLPKTVTVYSDKVYCQLLAYKDARVDMTILDTVVGSGLWQNEYKRDSKGVLQCGIGIYNEELKEWVWKWSNGVESDFQSEKGEYSDAFKRAGFMWGIGRSLYDFPNIRVQLNEKEYKMNGTKAKATGYFKPNTWNWQIEIDEENGKYLGVKAFDKNGNRRF